MSQVSSEQTYCCNHVNTANIDDTHGILCLNILLLCYCYRDFKGHLDKGFLSPSSWFFFSSYLGKTGSTEKSLLPGM